MNAVRSRVDAVAADLRERFAGQRTEYEQKLERARESASEIGADVAIEWAQSGATYEELIEASERPTVRPEQDRRLFDLADEKLGLSRVPEDIRTLMRGAFRQTIRQIVGSIDPAAIGAAR